MKKVPIILISMLFITLTTNGQNLFFIGENSYPCTETFTLQSNSEDGNDLSVLIARDGTQGLFAVNTDSFTGVKFSGKTIIYLVDGTIITSIDKATSEHVDNRVKAVYYLTNDELNKMKNSDIHTVRYTLKCNPCKGFISLEEGNWTASNKDIPTKNIITEFFDNVNSVKEVTVKKEQEPKKTKLDALMGELHNEQGQPNGDSYTTSYFESPGLGNGEGDYGLNGRSLVASGKVQQKCNESGRVVVKIVVDRNGNVISATPGVRGTTNNNPCLLEPAKKTAFMHKWNLDSNAPSQQIGFVVVNYKLGG